MDAILETLRFKYFEEGRRLVLTARLLLSEIEIDLSECSHSDELFRIMHTLKGNSAMFGESEVEEISKYLESIFDLVRKGKMQISNEIIEVCHISLNQIEALLGSAKPFSKSLKNNQKILISRLQKFEHPIVGFDAKKELNAISKLALESFAILHSSFQNFLPGVFSKNLNEGNESVDASLL